MRSLERAPSAATARRARIEPPPASESSPACLPGRQRATEAARRATPSRSHSVVRARTMSSVKAIWASGSPSLLASKWRCGRRTASRTRPSMIPILRIGCALGSIASQAPMRSKRRRGPSAIATARSGGSALSWAEAGAGSTTATEMPAPSACFRAAASDKPAAPPPAMATSKTGTGSVKGRGSPGVRQFRTFAPKAQCAVKTALDANWPPIPAISIKPPNRLPAQLPAAEPQ